MLDPAAHQWRDDGEEERGRGQHRRWPAVGKGSLQHALDERHGLERIGPGGACDRRERCGGGDADGRAVAPAPGGHRRRQEEGHRRSKVRLKCERNRAHYAGCKRRPVATPRGEHGEGGEQQHPRVQGERRLAQPAMDAGGLDAEQQGRDQRRRGEHEREAVRRRQPAANGHGVDRQRDRERGQIDRCIVRRRPGERHRARARDHRQRKGGGRQVSGEALAHGRRQMWIGLPVTAIAASLIASLWVGWAWQV